MLATEQACSWNSPQARHSAAYVPAQRTLLVAGTEVQRKQLSQSALQASGWLS